MKVLLFTVCISMSWVLLGQDSFSDRLFFSGGGGVSIGSEQTNISVFPQVGYRVTDRYAAGVGITYQYVRIKRADLTLNNYGWNLFNRFSVTEQFFAYAEYERLYFEFPALEGTDRSAFNSLLVGAGYTESIGGRASFSVTALYNVLYDEMEIPRPYNSPWVIRAGVGIGI